LEPIQRAKEEEEAEKLIEDAKLLERWLLLLFVLEKIPAHLKWWLKYFYSSYRNWCWWRRWSSFSNS
jgi:hypothetical protein